jgi:serine/threonine-protein kinase RsbW
MVSQAFPRDTAALASIYEFVRRALKHWDITEDHAWNVDLVLEELFTNIVKYGRRSEVPVSLELAWIRPVLTMRLRDEDSDFFDPTAAPAPDVEQPITERRAGGLGLHFVRRMAERFEYTHENSVSTLTVTLRLEC